MKNSIIDRFSTSDIVPLIRQFTLNQRSINCRFRKSNGINRTDIEILMFASTLTCFNAYEAQKYFIQMNLQQVRLAIRKLVKLGAIEIWSTGGRSKPSVYIIGYKGRKLLNIYGELWLTEIASDHKMKL